MSLPKCLPNNILQQIFEDNKIVSNNMAIRNHEKIINRFDEHF